MSKALFMTHMGLGFVVYFGIRLQNNLRLSDNLGT